MLANLLTVKKVVFPVMSTTLMYRRDALFRCIHSIENASAFNISGTFSFTLEGE